MYLSLVTSQNVTAPKLVLGHVVVPAGLVTSQNVTAPKPNICCHALPLSLVTSQNVTAPKRWLLFLQYFYV